MFSYECAIRKKKTNLQRNAYRKLMMKRSKTFFEKIYCDICVVDIRQNFNNRLSRKSKFVIDIYHNRKF